MSSFCQSFLIVFFVSVNILIPVVSHAFAFKEDFDKGQSATGWKCYGGAWEVKNKQYSSNSCYGYSIALNTDFLYFSYSADILLNGDGNAGVIFSVSDPAEGRDSVNCYYVALNKETSQVCLYKLSRSLKPDYKPRKGNKVLHNSEEIINVLYPVRENENYTMQVIKGEGWIDVYINDEHLISISDKTHGKGAIGLKTDSCDAVFDNIAVDENYVLPEKIYDWSWVKGVVFVPTNCVNQVQQWEEFDPRINERELMYAQTYGLNMVRIYLHYLVWEKDKTKFLNHLETFLSLAEKHGLKTEIIFLMIYGTGIHILRLKNLPRQDCITADGCNVLAMILKISTISTSQSLKHMYKM